MRIYLPALLLASTVLAQSPQAPPKGVPQQGPPPKNLSVRPDGHVTANQDPVNPEKFDVYVVKKGDTLSGISGDALKNPRLWPQLWEQNDHIINPHWIYPDDKILIRPVTVLAEAKPPEPEPEPAPAPPTPPRRPVQAPVPAPAPAAPSPQQNAERSFVFEDRTPVSEVKFDDLYCSGFLSTSPVPKNLKVLSKFDASGGVLATEPEYVYLSQGSDDGIMAGSVYEAIRPTKVLTNPKGRTKVDRELGMHYLEVGQLRVVLAQPQFSLARVLHNCGDAVDVGDTLIPFKPIVLPPRERSRPFSPTMVTTSGVKGSVVSSKSVLLSFGSAFKASGMIPGVPGGKLASMERGIASTGGIVYVDIGQDKAKPGDVFIAYRNLDLDKRLYSFPIEAAKLKGTRAAIGELILIKVGERGSTALVTYASDALALGDAVERR
jgi:hypothetical protein